MEPQEVTYDDVVNYVSGSILSGPEDDIWDVIFDWIANETRTIVNTVISWINMAVGWITENVSRLLQLLISPLNSAISWIRDKVEGVYYWVLTVYDKIAGWITSAYSIVSSAVTSAISTVHTWLLDTALTISSWVTTEVQKVWQWITTAVAGLWANLTMWGKQLWADISGLFSSWGKTIADFFVYQTNLIGSYWADWFKQRGQDMKDMQDWMTTNIVKPMNAWWDWFLAKVFDFGSWVGKLFDAVADWFSVDIPGASPRWTKIFSDIGHWFATWFYEFPKWFFGDFPERVAYGLSESWKWASKGLETTIETFMEAIMGLAGMIGPISPELATKNYASLAKVGLMSITGLIGMTVAGELLHPLKQLGLGQLSAVIWDATNYKLITGALVGALAYTAIRTPLTYYYHDLFRPQLPRLRDASDFYARDLLSKTEFSRLMGYEGYADVYHDKFADVAYRPVSLYALSSLATTGVFDEKLFADNLRDLGLKPELRELVLTMYKAKATETVKGMMSGVAMTRFKEGFTTEGQFTSELKLLRYSEEEIPMFTAAAELSYATDYLTDMKAAYTDAVRKGAISIDEYRDALSSLGIVPERVGSFVLRQRIYLRPKEKPTPIGPPGEIYLTDQGKMITDTIRRRRLKETLTRDEEIAELLGLGMPVDYSEAIADNDDIRLAEKKELEPKEIPRKYETDAGKVEIDTIRRERRKLLITREQEVKRLLTLEMPDWFAEAIAGNDDVRLTEKSTE